MSRFFDWLFLVLATSSVAFERLSSRDILIQALSRINQRPSDVIAYLKRSDFNEKSAFVIITYNSKVGIGIDMGIAPFCGKPLSGEVSKFVALPESLWKGTNLDIRCLNVGKCSDQTLSCLNNASSQLFNSNVEMKSKIIQVLETFLFELESSTTSSPESFSQGPLLNELVHLSIIDPDTSTKANINDIFAEIEHDGAIRIKREYDEESSKESKNEPQEDSKTESEGNPFITRSEFEKKIVFQTRMFWANLIIDICVMVMIPICLLFCLLHLKRRQRRFQRTIDAEADAIRRLVETTQRYKSQFGGLQGEHGINS